MTAPAHVVEQVERALDARVAHVESVGGWCINRGTRLVTQHGERFFLKWNPSAPARMFEAEADGLRALGEPRAIRVPAVVAVGAEWLLIEWIETGRPSRTYARELGEGLAAVHAAGRGGAWGWGRDNFIGSLRQANTITPTWGEFWRDARLAPQLARARGRGHFAGARGAAIERVVERTPELLADVEAAGASLLHGDLWGGNVIADAEGNPVLIDPAVYRGHGEVDLAMSELFGGFPAGWPTAYHAAAAVGPAYRAFRRDLYQLYYLLVHVNLFGAGYEAGCLSAAEGVLRGS